MGGESSAARFLNRMDDQAEQLRSVVQHGRQLDIVAPWLQIFLFRLSTGSVCCTVCVYLVQAEVAHHWMDLEHVKAAAAAGASDETRAVCCANGWWHSPPIDMLDFEFKGQPRCEVRPHYGATESRICLARCLPSSHCR